MIKQISIIRMAITLSLLFIVFTGTGCSLINRHNVNQETDLELVRELLSPLYAGQMSLINTLEKTDHEQILFTIENNRVKQVPKKVVDSALWSNKNILFFKTWNADKIHHFYYLDPTTFQLIPLRNETNNTDTENELCTFSLFKAVSHHSLLRLGEQKQSLVKISFGYNNSGKIQALGIMEIPDISGDAVLPVHLVNQKRVYFLTRDNEEPAKLMSINIMGEDLKQHLKHERNTINRVFTEDGTNLLVESDKKGYQSIFKLGNDGQSLSEYHFDASVKRPASPYIMAGQYAQAETSTVIVKLPDTMDLKTITALVVARNASVNMKRALFAAELVQAGMAKLPNYPSFQFELGTTSPTEILNNQRNFVTGTLVNGLFGLIQPLLDIRRNTELGRAAQITAESFKHQIDNEINERVAEACSLYFEINYLYKTTSVWTELLTLQKKRKVYYSNLMGIGETDTIQLRAAEKIITAGNAEMQYSKDRSDFLLNQLKKVCGLSQNTTIHIADDSFHMNDSFFQEDKGNLQKLALLNHPRIQIIASEFKKAYFLEAAGPTIRGQLNIAAEYEYLGRSLKSPVTDNVNLTLSGSISTAHQKSASLHTQYWKNIKESLHLRYGITADEIQLGLSEALLDYSTSKNDYQAKNQDAFYYLEKLRVNRLYHSLEKPDSTDEGDPLLVDAVIQEYLTSIQNRLRVNNDLGQRYINVWREVGLAKLIPDKIDTTSLISRDKTKPSLWLWRTEDVISNPSKTAEFIASAKRLKVKRVYAYLYSDTRLLSDLMTRERFTLFLNACAAEEIEVWALLGEPEWLTESTGSQSLRQGLQRIREYNVSKNRFEPRIIGLKLDLEPHSVQGWNTDSSIQEELKTNYLSLLKTAKKNTIPPMPLWVDCPVKYFLDPKNKELINQIENITDGITAMVYYNSPEKIIELAEKILAQSVCPTEIGIEFSSSAPVLETLYTTYTQKPNAVIKKIADHFFDIEAYSGISLHDYSALRTLTGDGQELK